VDSLTILATQVGVAVFHSRQLEEHKVALSDTRRLFLEAEVNLREAQRLNQRLTGQAWEDYLKSRSSQIVGYTLADNRLQRDSAWTPELQQAAGSRRAVLSSPKPDRQIIAVPIELRGRAIGAIEVEMEGAIRQTETLEVLQSVAQRLALSIDNARLFEQAQDIAQRELEVNTISTNLQSLNDIDDLARATIQELSRALGAAQASIRLGALPIAQPANRENGNDYDRQ
jgi:GAF domain-containing protein